MISLGTRYVDYGLTGGFFIFLGAALFWWLDPVRAADLSKSAYDQLAKKSNENIETLITGVLTSLFVVCVFAAGLLLDLVGSVFIHYEVQIFRHHLRRNKGWLEPLLARYQDFLAKDVEQFLLARDWSQLRTWLDLTTPVRFVLQMGRIESLLLSHLLLTADRTKIDYIVDQLRTCRLARAISSGSWILLFISLVLLAMKVLTVARTFTTLEVDAEPVVTAAMGKVLTLNIVFAIASALLFVIVWLAYTKFCRSLFSSIYVLLKSEQRNAIPGPG